MLKIDIGGILNEKLGRKMPRFLISFLEKLIHQDDLNDILRVTDPNTGSAFCTGVYDYLHLELSVEGLENLRDGERYIFASNHPLGGLDGIGLIKILGAKYGDDNISFLVNDMLMYVEPLRDVFLPINKFGAQGRAASAAIAKAYESEGQIIIFPAGLVSRLQKGGEIKDLQWQKSFVQKAIEYKRDIVPVRFEALNRKRFYRTAKLRKMFGIKVNLEQAMLPAEVFAAKGKHFRVIFGTPIRWQEVAERVAAGEKPLDIAREIKSLTYNL